MFGAHTADVLEPERDRFFTSPSIVSVQGVEPMVGSA
jgi:hypothetical protein